MTLSVNTNGIAACDIGVELTLATITTANVFQLTVDLNAMAGGTTPDIIEIREYFKGYSGATERLLKVYTLIGVQSELMFVTVPRISPISIKYTIKQTQGTGSPGHDFPWSVLQSQ